MQYRYRAFKGLKGIKKLVATTIATLGLVSGSGILSFFVMGTASAATPATWNLTAPSDITFVCGGNDYSHTLNTVSEDRTTGNFTGTGDYKANNSYTWNIAGNTTGNNITFAITYTGSNSGYVLHGTGSINSDGSISGSVDNNCQTFSMPAGTAKLFCSPTGFYRDGIDMTAAIINQASVTGSVDATGCNIGVYFGPGHNGSVTNADVFGSNYFGVVVQQAKVNVSDSKIHNIGEVPFNGDQHGVGIYYATIAGVSNTDCTAGSTSGTIEHNKIYAYQKNGFAAVCAGTDVSVKDNTVQGNGPVNYIAQNGIEIAFGASGGVYGNSVSGNSYTGGNYASSGGILVYGGCGYPVSTATIQNNYLDANDVGVYAVNYDNSCSTVTPTVTKVKIFQNRIYYNAVNNTTGLCDNTVACGGANIGYQAGIDDVGNSDMICGNTIGGQGYAWQGMYNYSASPAVFTQTGKDSAFVRPIDAGDSFPTTNVNLCHNRLMYNDDPEIWGNVSYSAYGLTRHAVFSMESSDNKGVFKYSDTSGSWYDVKVLDVKVSGHNGYFAGVVTKASNSSWVGKWLFAEVKDNRPDQIWGSFTDQTTAQIGVNNMTNPADGPFTVKHGYLRVH